jgi:hypothetical protein
METIDTIHDRVKAEIERINDKRLIARISELLVEPYTVVRAWDYGKPGEAYECWTVLEHRESNTGIAFCEQGFGSACPWGLIFLSGPDMGIGMDCNWYSSLEDAMRESQAWDVPNPPAYEVK